MHDHRGPRRARVAAFALLAILPAVRPASSTAARDAAEISAARRLVLRWMRETGAPGAVVAVARGGRVLWSEGFGLADLEQRVRADAHTRLRIGSVSKPLTSAAMARLVEEGRLDLDAPIQKYVPDFPEKPWPVTARQLAAHLAGIRHYRPGEFENQRHYDDVRAGLAIFANDPLSFEPGTRYSYSSHGYNLLSAALETAAGEPFLALMRRLVFEPAGMRETSADEPTALVPGRGRFYTRGADGAVENALWVDNSYKWASGGFVSTPEDLVRFAGALAEGRLVRPETRDLLWTPQATRDGKSTGYGLGWGVGRDAKGRRRVSHSGGAQGSTAYLLVAPEERLAVALTVNSDDSFTRHAPWIADVFLDGPAAARLWRDPRAGFSFAIPDAWKEDYAVRSEAGAEPEGAAGPSRTVAFDYAPAAGAPPAAPLLAVRVYSKAAWERARGGGASGEVFAEDGERVFVASVARENPSALSGADARRYAAMRLTAAQARERLRPLAP